jgi:hypothetical protein
MTSRGRFTISEGWILDQYAPGLFHWMLPGDARSMRDYSSLISDQERAELAVTIAELEALDNQQAA